MTAMNENILIPIFTGIIGLFTGLLMPFVKWHIEKLKMRRLDRISFINQLREIISSDGFDIYINSRIPLCIRDSGNTSQLK